MTNKPAKAAVPLARRIRNLSFFFLGLIGLIFVGVYIFICPYFHKDLYDFVVLHPFKYPHWFPLVDTTAGIKAQPVTIPIQRDGKTLNLSGALYRHKSPRGLIIYCHGNTGPIDWRFGDPRVASPLEQNVDVLMFDYEGYGRSQGKHSMQYLVDDAVTVYDHALSLRYKQEEIIAYGESLGGAVACQLAKQRKVKGLVVECTFMSPAQEAKELLPAAAIYPDFAFPTPRFDNVQYMRGEHPPCLILCGGRDTTILPKHSQRLKEVGGSNTELVMLPKSGHCLLMEEDKALYDRAYKKFLDGLLGEQGLNANPQ